jgi:hypothetical protein
LTSLTLKMTWSSIFLSFERGRFNPRGLLLLTQLVQLATNYGQVAQADLSIVTQMAVRPPFTASLAP